MIELTYIYLFLSLVITVLVAVIFRNNKKDPNLTTQNVLTSDSIQLILAEFLKKQQSYQDQFTQTQLMNIFRAPKLRGLFGEKWLDVLLGEVLPAQHFSMQHTFSTGSICDAVILLHNGKKLSIDSKFSMENFLKIANASSEIESKEFEKEFHKDIKARINEISKKYILPAEGTMDFAFMFVPAESVYYRTFIENNNELLEYAYQKNVIVVSPNTLYIYLQFILHGFKGYEIEKSARQFQQGLTGIMRDLKLLNDEYNKLKEKIDQAKKNFVMGSKILERVQFNLNNLHEMPITVDQNLS